MRVLNNEMRERMCAVRAFICALCECAKYNIKILKLC